MKVVYGQRFKGHFSQILNPCLSESSCQVMMFGTRVPIELLFTIIAIVSVGGLFLLAWVRRCRTGASGKNRGIDSGAWLLWGLTGLAVIIVLVSLIVLLFRI
jgi:hypothetical protein